MDQGKLTNLLRACAVEKRRPDRSPYTSLLLADACKIAGATGASLRQVECAALACEIIPERYSRNQSSLSCADQLRLLQCHVAIIGLGGLGGITAEILARLGVGQLTLVDGDVFDESNLNRQLLSSPARIGEKKATAASTRIQEINPAVEVVTIAEFFTAANSEAILTNVHLAVDCLDTIPTRYVLQDACGNAAIPIVSGAIAGSSGQATTIFPGDAGFALIYGSPGKARQRGIEASQGTLPFAAVSMAATLCAETTTILLGRSPQLRHRLLLADTIDHTSEIFEFPDRSAAQPTQR